MKKDNAKTKDAIIEAAEKVFLEHGFAGASISKIAKLAKINQSLIYHYFKDKEELWKEVKRHVAEQVDVQAPKLDPNRDLKDLLADLIHMRFEIYRRNPKIRRLMLWQKLESEGEQLQGGTHLSPNLWNDIWIELQIMGKIRNDFSPRLITSILMSLVSGIFFDDLLDELPSGRQQEKYLEEVSRAMMAIVQA